MRWLAILLRPSTPVPDAYRDNFKHLYWDVFFFGILNGSAMSFLSIFATRLGAASWQVGLLTALPAVINLMFTLPAGRWLQGRPQIRWAFWTALLSRFFFLVYVPLPWIFTDSQQRVWALIFITLVMTIPATFLAVAFNTLFADAVPPDWRGHVVGIRNALLAIVTTLTTLLSGWLLTTLPFPDGYQVVFALGFLGSVASTYHLYFVRAFPAGSPHERVNQALGELAAPDRPRIAPDTMRGSVGLRFLTRARGKPLIRFDLFHGRFGKILGLLFFFHLMQYMGIPIFPVYSVQNLHLSDQVISLGSSVFFTLVFLGSTQLSRWTNRWGNRALTGAGIIVLGFFPVMLIASATPLMYMLTNMVGGFAWSIVGGALNNYLLEAVPDQNRPAHLAWYNLALNAAILLGSLGGPLIGNQVGLPATLMLVGVGRILSGIFILRLGR